MTEIHQLFWFEFKVQFQKSKFKGNNLKEKLDIVRPSDIHLV